MNQIILHEKDEKVRQIFIRIKSDVFGYFKTSAPEDIFYWVISYSKLNKNTIAIQADFYENWQVLSKYGDTYNFKNVYTDLYEYLEKRFSNYELNYTYDGEEQKLIVGHRK